jgi:hypothetical protein
MKMTLGLCRGRHDIPGVEEYIYPGEVNPLDLDGMKRTVHSALKNCNRLDLYVTGLTVALVEVINYCCYNYIPLTLWHYNRDSGEYYPQTVATCTDLDLLVEAGYYRKA